MGENRTSSSAKANWAQVSESSIKWGARAAFVLLATFPGVATFIACSSGPLTTATTTGGPPTTNTDGTTTTDPQPNNPSTTTTTTTTTGELPSCTDGAKNGNETDVDCGGTCPACAVAKNCAVPADCASNTCTAGKCAPAATCTDGVKNGKETDVDCGGAACGGCSDGQVCAAGPDCKSTVCTGGKCVAKATCANGTKDGNETDVDCGGGTCGSCDYQKTCATGNDCTSDICNPTTKKCECPNGWVDCNGKCVDLRTDKNNCMACAAACATTYCDKATCSNTCSLPAVDCNGSCVTLNTRQNCGVCGRACTSSQVCSDGVCVDNSTIAKEGCADGKREAFTDANVYPDIAGCAGAWSVPGIFPAPLRSNANAMQKYKVAACATNGNDKEAPGPGTDCSAADLCAPGWHICKGGEVASRAGGPGCGTLPAGERNVGFFSASVSGPGCGVCSPSDGTIVNPAICSPLSCAANCKERNDLTNDLFGCGGPSLSSGNCSELSNFSNDQCNAVGASWSCPSSTNEGGSVVKTASTDGGVLCCR